MLSRALLAAVAAAAAALCVAGAADLPPSCSRAVYCDSDLLHHVQLAQLYNDSKTFVDMRLLSDPNSTLAEFAVLLDSVGGAPGRDSLQQFVDEHFASGDELEEWTPTDHGDSPAFLAGVRDPDLRAFGQAIHDIWPSLGRRVKQEVFASPDRYSLIPVDNGFVIPGGRFKELYYWDTYWIIEGLLISEMTDTVKGVLENLIQLLELLGHVPNGSRWYYQQRSQPPLLTPMVSLYMRQTKDLQFLRDNIQSLEKELTFWLESRSVYVERGGRAHRLLQYRAPSAGPRPESYREDYEDAQIFDTDERRTQFYVDIKSGAESGWDFSSRWFIDSAGGNSGNLTDVHVTNITEVDLNSIFANSLKTVAYFQAILQNRRRAQYWSALARQWRGAIEAVFWHAEDGVWYDFDLHRGEHRRHAYPSNVAPLWMGAVDKRLVRQRAARVLAYLESSGLLAQPGGVPTSAANTGEQWDFPNAWPPLVSLTVNALEALETAQARAAAARLAQEWVRANRAGYLDAGVMFEKYDAERVGESGGGGEYTPQSGFGWTNGVVLELLARYGRTMTAADDPRAAAAAAAA